MSDNQKNLLVWLMMLVMLAVYGIVFFCTMPSFETADRVIYHFKSSAQTDEDADFSAPKGRSVSEDATGEKIHINTATKEELMTIPGIGDVYAERILAYRERNGGFTNPEELLNISGIGEKRLEKWKPYLDFD